MQPSYINYPFVSDNPNIIYRPSQYMPQYINPYFPQQFVPQYQYGFEDDMGIAQFTTTDRQPAPILSNNPASISFVLFKELTGYPNYGNPSRNADILYTGNRGSWTFELPAPFFIPGIQRPQIIIRASLDDHANVPVNRYSARITINGSVVHNGQLPLVHGSPAGGMFNNWRNLTFNVTNFRRTTRVTIDNTSTTGPNDWIAFDWMELRLFTR
jgi:hypothetical protein